MRRQLLTGVVLGALVLAACGDDDSVTTGTTQTDPSTVPDADADIALPTSVDAIVAELSIVGLFPVQPPYLLPAPTVTVYADGRVVVPGAQTMQYPGPLVGPLVQRRLDEVDVRNLMASAAEAGLLAEPPSYVEVPLAPDAPRTTLVLTTADGSWTHVADALGVGAGETGARKALYDFVTEVQELVGVDGETYTPERLAIQAVPADQAPPVDAGLEQPPVAWPESGPDLSTASTCIVVDDPATVRVLLDATSITPFTQGDATWRLAATPVLPGQSGC